MVPIILPSVVIPLIAVIVMTIMEAAVRPSPLSRKCATSDGIYAFSVSVSLGESLPTQR